VVNLLIEILKKIRAAMTRWLPTVQSCVVFTNIVASHSVIPTLRQRSLFAEGFFKTSMVLLYDEAVAYAFQIESS
ncbi:unnamed protein product, partial [Sphenostylis stenocarpa]